MSDLLICFKVTDLKQITCFSKLYYPTLSQTKEFFKYRKYGRIAQLEHFFLYPRIGAVYIRCGIKGTKNRFNDFC